jgi:hypothetical protein
LNNIAILVTGYKELQLCGCIKTINKYLVMKKTRFSMLVALIVAALFLSSYQSGPAHHAGYDCSGSETGNGNPTGCSTNGGCHGNTATSAVAVTIELDSANGNAVTKYKGGLTYIVKLTGVNNTTSTEAKFGFQLTAINGSTPTAAPVNAGTWDVANLPTGVQYSPASPGNYLANVIEHNTALSPSSGTGAAGTIYTESFTWTAPAKGTGTISFWAALNAVIGFDVASSLVDHWNTASLILDEDTSTATNTGFSTISNNMDVSIYPNPTTDFVQVELDNVAPGAYNINAYDAEGRKVATSVLEPTGSFAKTTINTSNWAAGIYLLQFTNGSEERVVRVVKR